MNCFIYIIIGLVAIIFGIYLGRKNSKGLIAVQAKKKAENKNKIIDLLREKGEIKNDDIEGLLGVSDATATRYMDELEDEGKVVQVGSAGYQVHYIIKD
jgi:Fic family protein